MEKMRNVLDHTLEILSGVSFLAMVVLTCWQVFTRYLLKNPSSWSEELVSYMFGWMAFFGASLVTGERGHMNIPLLTERLGLPVCFFYAVLPVSGVLCVVYTGLNLWEILKTGREG